MLERAVDRQRLSPGGTLLLTGRKSSLKLETNGTPEAEFELDLGSGVQSALVVPFTPQPGASGLLVLRSKRRQKPSPLSIELYESIAQLVGVAIARRSSQRALRERLKELTFLYRIAELFARPETGVEAIVEQAPALVAQGCPVPTPIVARVVIDDRQGWYPAPTACKRGLGSDIVVHGKRRGRVEARCANWHPDRSDSWERDEVQRFLNAVAAAIATALSRAELLAEKETLKAELQHAERLATIGTLMAIVAHEVNQPLSTISGFAELVAKDASLSDAARQDVGKIARASEHAHEVVRKLLTFSRPSEPAARETSLNRAVEDALALIEPSAARAGVRLLRRLEHGIDTLTVGHAELCQIVVNLATNAIRAMPEGGQLTLTTRRLVDGWTLVVEDTGVGIDDELKQRMFQPFVTTSGGGLGLGLAVVQDILLSHGGRIRVESELGRGTRMTVEFPERPVASYCDGG